MRTALDTNVLVLLLLGATQSPPISARLEALRAAGPLLICGAVYAELRAVPRLTKADLDAFLSATGIRTDFEMGEALWNEVGRAHATYAIRRRASGVGEPRRVLPDLIVGAHALQRADQLFSFDGRYSTDFPALRLVTL